MEGSLYVSEADMGWMLLQDETTKQLILRAHRNLPAPFSSRMHKPWIDDVSSLVMLSGQSLSIHGDGLSQFELVDFCKAVLIAPTKVRDQPIGVLCVAREDVKPFSERDQAMLEAVADYASISLVNARLFQALEARAKRLQQAVSETHIEEEVDPILLTGLKEALDSINIELTHLIDDVYDPEVFAGLEKISSKVGDLLEQIGSTRLTDDKLSDQPNSVSP
jgi:GAF domain-containing protein